MLKAVSKILFTDSKKVVKGPFHHLKVGVDRGRCEVGCARQNLRPDHLPDDVIVPVRYLDLVEDESRCYVNLSKATQFIE